MLTVIQFSSLFTPTYSTSLEAKPFPKRASAQDIDGIVCFDPETLPSSVQNPDRYSATFEFCALHSFVTPNAGCECNDGKIVCKTDTDADKAWAYWCLGVCYCRSKGTQTPNEVQTSRLVQWVMDGNEVPPEYENDPLPAGWSSNQQAVCKTTCGIFWGSCGDSCGCKASLATLFFWYVGSCAAKIKSPKDKRGLELDSGHGAFPLLSPRAASNSTQVAGCPNQCDQPSACNSTYVSCGCNLSQDGIVHEPDLCNLGA